jgi:hypothetical protein
MTNSVLLDDSSNAASEFNSTSGACPRPDRAFVYERRGMTMEILKTLIAEALAISQAASRENLSRHTQQQLSRMVSTRLFDAHALISQDLRKDRAISDEHMDDYQSYSTMNARQADSPTSARSPSRFCAASAWGPPNRT